MSSQIDKTTPPTSTHIPVAKPARKFSHSIEQPAQHLPDHQQSSRSHSPLAHNFGDINVRPGSTALIQTKLTIGPVNDGYEQEADHVAAQVVNRSESLQRQEKPEEEETEVSTKPMISSIQRQESSEEEETEVSTKPLISSIQRQESSEEEETEVSTKPHVQRRLDNGGVATPSVESAITERRGKGDSLAGNTRHSMERAFGADFSNVKVHTDAQADQLNQSIQARAFTTGQDIFFRQGEHHPETRSGQELLAHELTHVVQQSQGRLRRSYKSPTNSLQRQESADAGTAATAATATTSDELLNQWLAEHPDQHLSSDLAWIRGQWPPGGSMDDLDAGFRADVQALLDYLSAAGGQFHIISYARSPQKQHVMHVAQALRRGLINYDRYKFSGWSGVVAAGGRAALLALSATERKSRLSAINNPEVLSIVWDTGTQASSRADGTRIAEMYNIGLTNPVANGGATYSWPTGNTSTSLHGSGNAVDAAPVTVPSSLTIRQNQAPLWPSLATLQAAMGTSNVTAIAATASEAAGYTISGLNNVARRDALFDLFFRVRSAARAGFTDPQHFQSP